MEYGATSVQMMCIVNMFSCLLTAMSLFQQSSFPLIVSFMTKVILIDYNRIDIGMLYNIWCNSNTFIIMQYPSFIVDCILISICSASGQLYIFYTISKFGPVTFVIMMTIRQVITLYICYQISWIIQSYETSFLFAGLGDIVILFDLSSSGNSYRYYWYNSSIWFGILTNLLQ